MLAWLKKPRVWISLLGTGLFLYFLLRTLDYKEFADALREANYLYITPAVAIYFIAVWFRSWRWQVLL
ncbi:MAG: flippase-like domain-containing protein, partial [Chloroflexi bacterium]|nr:flippase-like domain-containing protein [Chloroflexota bacterium]